jgi:bifunctional DNA-binding transcriptional regulator/antitoxin component of YhaV-PrlF toxin-antitoxin module
VTDGTLDFAQGPIEDIVIELTRTITSLGGTVRDTRGGIPRDRGGGVCRRSGAVDAAEPLHPHGTCGAGRDIVIPSEIRREAGLQPDMPLDVRWRDGVIEIEPQPLPVTLTRRGRLLVATPASTVEPLRTDVVERTRRRINER